MQRIVKQALLTTPPGVADWTGLLRLVRDDMQLINYPQVAEQGLHPTFISGLYDGPGDLSSTMLRAIPEARKLGLTGDLRVMRDSIKDLGGDLFQRSESNYKQFAHEGSWGSTWDVETALWVEKYQAFVNPIRQAQAANPRALGNGLQKTVHIYTHGTYDNGNVYKRSYPLAMPAYMSLATDLGYLACGLEIMLERVNPKYVESDREKLADIADAWLRFKRAYAHLHGVVAERQV